MNVWYTCTKDLERHGTLSEETRKATAAQRVSIDLHYMHSWKQFFDTNISKTVCHSMVSEDTDPKREETRERKTSITTPPLAYC